MKITISHDQEGIDPSATYTAEQFIEVRKALEAEYEKAILAEYPEAEIDFGGTDTTYAIRVTGMDDPSDIEDNVQSICETVFETGNFWLGCATLGHTGPMSKKRRGSLSVTNIRREPWMSVVTICEVDAAGERDGFEEIRIQHQTLDASDDDAGDIDAALAAIARERGVCYE